MAEVLLKILGINLDGGEQEERVELITEGDLSQVGEEIHLSYAESELSGMSGYTTSLVLVDDTVRMTRRKAAEEVETEIFFQKGIRHTGLYETPYGLIEMEVLTNKLTSDVTCEAGGSIEIDYSISLKGLSEGRNMLNIQVDRRQ